MTLIYKIVPDELWRKAAAIGIFAGSAVDRQDGFIHFSDAESVGETARRHFSGQENLLLVAVWAARLGSDLKWEPSRGGALFPHLYAPLQMSAVAWVVPLPLGPDGRHLFPRLDG